jgi:hypothetical protein
MKTSGLVESGPGTINSPSDVDFENSGQELDQADRKESLNNCLHLPINRSGFVSRCIGLEEATLLSKFHVHVVTSSEKTVAIILDRRPGALHKYLMTHDEQGHEYLLSMPVGWIKRHRNILERLEAASGRLLGVGGGGFIMWAGQLLVYGLSVEFGPGDHNFAREEFGRALASAPLFSPAREA